MNRMLAVASLLTVPVLAQINATEVVTLPSAAAWGGGDVVGSQLIGRTYNAGNGPGIWIVADGGYRLYYNGALLAQDNQAGRITFVPMTFLPGTNAVSVVGIDGNGVPGVLVQIDELEKTHVSGATWKVATSASDNSWKYASYSDAAWSAATASGSASTTPSGATLSGFAGGSTAKWIWASSSAASQAVLRYTFKIQAEGFGAATTGGAGGTVVVAKTLAEIKTALQSTTATTILVPEGTYDLRTTRTEYKDQSAYNWCTRSCNGLGVNTTKTYYRVTFDGTCGTGESVASSIERWDTWIPIKPNKSVIGMGRGANLRGVSIAMRGNESASNGIFRNLAIYDVNPHLIEAGDGLTTDNTSKFWADHISYKWISDGMDIGGSTGTTEATVSWMEYDGSNDQNCYGNDPYVALVEDAELTYANNYWRNTSGRVPKVSADYRATKVHMYNNYVDSNTFFVVGAHGTSSYKAEVLLENNYLKNAKGYPTMKEPYGYINSTGNSWAGTTGTHQLVDASGNRSASVEPTDNVFTPAYAYAKRTVANLPSENMLNTGVGGKWGAMPSYTQAFGLSNQAPTVSLSAPTTGTSYTAPASITLTATATDADGSVASVAFYVGNTLVGTDNSSPYSVAVANVLAGTHSLVAVATDNSGLQRMSDFVTITVTGTTNAAPVITSGNTVAVAENAGKWVQNIVASDANGDALTYSISGGDDQDDFIVNSSTGGLWMARNPDYESPRDADANNQYKVRVRATDPAGLYVDQSVVVTVTDVNESPTALTLSAASVLEGLAAGSLVGTLLGADPDATATLNYTFAPGGTDNASFVLAGTNLQTAAVFDFATQSNYNILLRVTDEGGLYFDQAFTVAVTETALESSSSALSSSWTSSSSSATVSSSSAGTISILASASWRQQAVSFVVFDLAGRPQVRSANLPWGFAQGVWVVRAYDAQGHELHSWLANGR
jgi:hypothetical protein